MLGAIMEITPIQLLTILGWLLIAVGVGVGRLRVADCPECPHCRALREAEIERQQAAADAVFYRGLPRPCPRCGREHPAGDPDCGRG